MKFPDTIAAIATPPGVGGIAVIRISGKDAVHIAAQIFRGNASPEGLGTHRVIHGNIIQPETGEEVDEVLLTVMRAPNSYTGENVVEISCHGGIVTAQRVLTVSIKAGATEAARGEFTKRAFLNGKIDLMQAEAVLDIVGAKTEKGLKSAFAQLKGALSHKLEKLKKVLLSVLKNIELSLDFAEEDVSTLKRNNLAEKIKTALREITEIIDEDRRASIVRDGISAAIVGRPNVGKSSLLNALLLEERAIVTPIPGTTRDIIEGWINVRGIPLKLYDTCGFQNAENIVEAKGIEKTKDAMHKTSFLLFVTDGSAKISEEDREIFDVAKGKKLIIVINKIDLPQKIEISEMLNGSKYPICKVSAKEHEGIQRLNEEVMELIKRDSLSISNGSNIRSRHLSLFLQAEQSIRNALESLLNRKELELVAEDIKESMSTLGELIGESTPEEVLDEIFGEFCIGK